MTTLGPIPLNKGWISDSDIYNCPPGGGLTFSSFMPWANGSIKTIDGPGTNFRCPTGGSGAIINGFTTWQDPAQITTQGPTIVVPSSGKVYTAPLNSSPVFTDRTGATTPEPTGIYTFDSLNGKLLLFNSGSSFTTVPLKLTTFNGNVANLGGSPPIGNVVKVVNNFAFVGQVLAAASTASTIYWSAVADPETWPAASSLAFRPNDGDFISALAALGSNLVVFKQNSIGILSTTTLTLSGAVTLGPLTQLTDRIGCASATSVDQMPDGTLVFLGMDRNLYNTDGNSIVGLSNLPSPQSNYSYNANFVQATPPHVGISFSSVKVDPISHRIWVLMNSILTANSVIYVYDYFTKVWMDWSEISADTTAANVANRVTCLGYMETQLFSSRGETKTVWVGTNTGWLCTFNPSLDFNHIASSGKSWPCVYETSIPLGGSNPPDFIPRNIFIPYTMAGVVQQCAYQVDIGWDGTYQGTPPITGTLTKLKSRIRVPVALTPVSVGINPSSLQIKITLTANLAASQVVIDPLYITDEVFQ